ncbi:MAG TPA: carbamoyl phosphate synthase small subunit, partial [Sphaerochaeta sp.]|nr:carbamoyl phosphate synthase small subunit [Sphaerochaeta sp.]
MDPDLGSGFVSEPSNPRYRIALADFGIKISIIENFYRRDVSVTLLPPTFKADDVLEKGFDMLFLSNGPGDPELLQDAVAQVKACIGKLPVCGICLGHQLITWALGG